MVAEVALLRGVRFRVDEQRVVGARVHARLAADAVVVLEVDNAVVGTEQCVRRADRHARRVFALIAPHHREVSTRVGKFAGLDVLHPGPVDAERHIVFALARNRAGVAADTGITVEQEPQSGHRSPIRCGELIIELCRRATASLHCAASAPTADRPTQPVGSKVWSMTAHRLNMCHCHLIFRTLPRLICFVPWSTWAVSPGRPRRTG